MAKRGRRVSRPGVRQSSPILLAPVDLPATPLEHHVVADDGANREQHDQRGETSEQKY
jgi:hypothetical protein